MRTMDDSVAGSGKTSGICTDADFLGNEVAATLGLSKKPVVIPGWLSAIEGRPAESRTWRELTNRTLRVTAENVPLERRSGCEFRVPGRRA